MKDILPQGAIYRVAANPQNLQNLHEIKPPRGSPYVSYVLLVLKKGDDCSPPSGLITHNLLLTEDDVDEQAHVGDIHVAVSVQVGVGASGEVPEGYVLVYSVNGTAIEGDTFTMPYDDVTVTVAIEQAHVLGDLNGDGNVDVTDVSILIDVVLGKDVTLADGANTDLNSDGNVDVTDVSLLIDIILGK